MNNKNTGNRNVGTKNNLANKNIGSANRNIGSANRNIGSANRNIGSANRNNGNANSNRNLTNNFTNNSNNSQSTSIVKDVIVAVLVLVVVGILVYFATSFLRKHLLGKSDQPWILQDSKNGKNSLVVTQDPRNENSITLYRSDDAETGAEFTYSFWFVVENMEYKYGELKHIFHKGNKSGNPNRAPGVFLHPTSNTILVYMNTVNNIMEHVKIENIPLRRWVHMAIILKGQYLDIYVNGFLRKRHELSSVPKQNFGDLWLNLNGGFDGYMCKMRYYRRAIEYNEVEHVVRGGPSEAVCGDTGEKPPYLDDNWWFDF